MSAREVQDLQVNADNMTVKAIHFVCAKKATYIKTVIWLGQKNA